MCPSYIRVVNHTYRQNLLNNFRSPIGGIHRRYPPTNQEPILQFPPNSTNQKTLSMYCCKHNNGDSNCTNQKSLFAGTKKEQSANQEFNLSLFFLLCPKVCHKNIRLRSISEAVTKEATLPVTKKVLIMENDNELLNDLR